MHGVFFCGAIVTHYSFSFGLVDHHCWITKSTGWPLIESTTGQSVKFCFFVCVTKFSKVTAKKISHFISQKQSATFVSPKGIFTIITWIIKNSNATQPGQITVAMWHTDSSSKKTSKLFAILISSSMTKSTWAADMKLKMKNVNKFPVINKPLVKAQPYQTRKRVTGCFKLKEEEHHV